MGQKASPLFNNNNKVKPVKSKDFTPLTSQEEGFISSTRRISLQLKAHRTELSTVQRLRRQFVRKLAPEATILKFSASRRLVHPSHLLKTLKELLFVWVIAADIYRRRHSNRKIKNP